MTPVAMQIAAKRRAFLKTTRRDGWWVAPVLTFLGFSAFIVYSTWAAFQGNHYTWGPYLSPFYSPELFGTSPHALFGGPPTWWPALVPFSPSFFIVGAPLGFRFTCYYYRGAYYKAFWGDPPACAVGEPRSTYLGEKSLPLILQNVHRYFLYLAIGFILILSYDVFLAFFRWPEGSAPGLGTRFGVGVGSLLMLVNVGLISAYTFGCHSLRHHAGGKKDQLPKHLVGKSCYQCVSALNRRHMLFAWCSLTSVGLTDLYIRLCSMGVITDFRII